MPLINQDEAARSIGEGPKEREKEQEQGPETGGIRVRSRGRVRGNGSGSGRIQSSSRAEIGLRRQGVQHVLSLFLAQTWLAGMG